MAGTVSELYGGAINDLITSFKVGRQFRRAARSRARRVLAAARLQGEELLRASERERATQRARFGAAGVTGGSAFSVDAESRASLFLEQQRILHGAGFLAESISGTGRAQNRDTVDAGAQSFAGPYRGLF